MYSIKLLPSSNLGFNSFFCCAISLKKIRAVVEAMFTDSLSCSSRIRYRVREIDGYYCYYCSILHAESTMVIFADYLQSYSDDPQTPQRNNPFYFELYDQHTVLPRQSNRRSKMIVYYKMKNVLVGLHQKHNIHLHRYHVHFAKILV